MIISYTEFGTRVVVALLCGAIVGAERQWRQRMAGLRTNALVSMGAGAFVALSTMFPNETSSSRIAAQVVSGIGFIGGGVILREGLNITGLNTAATIWCSAATGSLAGSGFAIPGLMTAVLVAIANLLLRPIGRTISKQSTEATELPSFYKLETTCLEREEQHIRVLLLQSLVNDTFTLKGIRSEDLNGSGKVRVRAELITAGRCDKQMESIINRLTLEPGVSAISWEVLTNESVVMEC
jgi:putative Mg2+ transporter-C (MgtC) family protein